MKRRVLLQLGIPLLILCALFLLLAYPADRTLRPQPLLEVSVILRETDVNLWTNTRQGMEQAAVDLDVELRFLTPAQNNDAAQQAELRRRCWYRRTGRCWRRRWPIFPASCRWCRWRPT